MKKLTSAIVAKALPEVVKAAILDVFVDFDERIQKILAEKIMGVFEIPMIPAESNVAKDAVLQHYNLLEDRVFYTYTREETRWFDDEQDASNWKTGKSCYSGYYKEDEKYTISVTKEYRDSSSCSLDKWLQKQ